MKMIHVKPAPGFRILNPFAGHGELPAEGETMPADTFWYRREAEGGVIITDPDAKPAKATATATSSKG